MKDRVARIRRRARMVVEARYAAIPSFLDRRGQIIAQIHPVIEAKMKHWQISEDNIVFADTQTKARSQFLIGLKRIAVLVEDPDSLQSFLDWSDKCLKLAYESMGSVFPLVERIGVRFIEIVTSPNKDYETTLNHLLRKFHNLPVDLPLDYTDSQAVLIHKYGRYAIGPTKKGDLWIKQNFEDHERNVPDVGCAVDVDSFIANVAVKNVNDLLAASRSVAGLTTSVEEALLRGAGVLSE